MNDRTLRLTAGQPVQDLFRYAIGLEEMLLKLSGSNSGNFPPHNIERVTDNHYVLTLALAGFSRSDIEITVHKGILKIVGSKAAAPRTTVMPVDRHIPESSGGGVIKELVEVETEVLYQGIAYRDFTREFRIGEGVEIKSATMRDGLLIISLERQAPPEETPTKIKID